jgi:hypothetical protein
MGVLKKCLIGLGSLFGLLIIIAIALGISSWHFKSQQTPFVTRFVADLSHRWEIADVYDRLSNSFIEQASTPDGQRSLQRIRTLGALSSIRDVELRNYTAGTLGTTAVFAFKGTFENGVALVTVTLLKKSGTVRVQGFHVDPVPGDAIPSHTRTQT